MDTSTDNQQNFVHDVSHPFLNTSTAQNTVNGLLNSEDETDYMNTSQILMEQASTNNSVPPPFFYHKLIQIVKDRKFDESHPIVLALGHLLAKYPSFRIPDMWTLKGEDIDMFMETFKIVCNGRDVIAAAPPQRSSGRRARASSDKDDTVPGLFQNNLALLDLFVDIFKQEADANVPLQQTSFYNMLEKHDDPRRYKEEFLATCFKMIRATQDPTAASLAQRLLCLYRSVHLEYAIRVPLFLGFQSMSNQNKIFFLDTLKGSKQDNLNLIAYLLEHRSYLFQGDAAQTKLPMSTQKIVGYYLHLQLPVRDSDPDDEEVEEDLSASPCCVLARLLLALVSIWLESGMLSRTRETELSYLRDGVRACGMRLMAIDPSCAPTAEAMRSIVEVHMLPS
eukprot:TRINITY_DN8521_c0_g1_i1.p1 TRINITY_DN8521_c0_g1~~TRINITY_DN8521_c0_g1_i1.p1  ORF type:complete len:394 (+),score=31.32 TRINITY_DN8521_c0_g1_i1:50-1231(+)